MNLAFHVFQVFQVGGNCKTLETGFELLELTSICDFEPILDELLCFEFRDFHEFVEEHFENHDSFPEMLVIIASKLALFGNGRHW